MVTVLKSAGRAGDHFSGDGVEVRALAQFEQLPQVLGALGFSALLLKSHLQRSAVPA